MAKTIAIRIAGRSSALLPAGTWVEMTTASETPPATERSNPPCCTTSICPSPTIARTAANGRLPDSAPAEMLEGAKM